jgi:hypothetical protein
LVKGNCGNENPATGEIPRVTLDKNYSLVPWKAVEEFTVCMCESDYPRSRRYRTASKCLYDEPTASNVMSPKGGKFDPITIRGFDTCGVGVQTSFETGQFLLKWIFVFWHLPR